MIKVSNLKIWFEGKFTDILFVWKLIIYSFIVGSILGISTFLKGNIQYENYIEIVGFELFIFHVVYLALSSIILYFLYKKNRFAYDFSIALLFIAIIDSIRTFIGGIGISSTLYLIGDIFFSLLQVFWIIVLYLEMEKFGVK
mgnify:CR=1 FL=1